MNYLPSVVAATSNCIKTMLFGEICDNCEGGPIYKLILMAVKLLTIGFGTLATIGIIVVGVQYLTARDDANQVAKAKKRFLDIVIGIGIYGLMYLIIELLVPGEIMTVTPDTSTSTCTNPTIATPEPITSQPVTGGSSGGSSSGSSSGSSQPGGGGGDYDPTKIPKYTPATKSPTGLTTLNALDENWTIVNTKFGVRSYMTSLNKRHVAQDKQDCYDSGSCTSSTRDNDKCLSFAYTFAYDLVYGTTTCDHCASAYKRGGFYGVQTKSKEDALTMIYDQLVNGWPVVVQVKFSTGTGRHFVTAVGIKSSVKSRSQFTENDILFMNTNGALWKGNSKRVMKANGSYYTSNATMGLWTKSAYGYYVLPFKSPGSVKNPQNIKSC